MIKSNERDSMGPTKQITSYLWPSNAIFNCIFKTGELYHFNVAHPSMLKVTVILQKITFIRNLKYLDAASGHKFIKW